MQFQLRWKLSPPRMLRRPSHNRGRPKELKRAQSDRQGNLPADGLPASGHREAICNLDPVRPEDCLDESLQHIAADSPVAAAKVLEVVLAAAESLSVFSERGRIVPEVGSRLIREIFVYRFRLMYQVSSSDVRILAVLHGAMDFDRWLRHT